MFVLSLSKRGVFGIKHGHFEIRSRRAVFINDPFIALDYYMVYLIKHDSTHDIGHIIETTGVFTTIDECQSLLQADAKDVIITAPSTNAAKTIYIYLCYF
ncbi:unnamed protein product [Adineta steineri]|uniref:Glyceraldehyde 3-phosphate dehydrogenase NAD(P) binding domain-containing protein n=1 Tax=Adineta steineri TaxID=433720 RepID=A0A815Q7G1_9BILA|nr:unnamed protein product [Adineta steineri]CAF1279260.1 unnamed protein product [Adineta steineri]CAF1459953.1 unnamed protein product [Adineta steineri]